MASFAVSMNKKDDNIKIFSMAKYTDQKEKNMYIYFDVLKGISVYRK